MEHHELIHGAVIVETRFADIITSVLRREGARAIIAHFGHGDGFMKLSYIANSLDEDDGLRLLALGARLALKLQEERQCLVG